MIQTEFELLYPEGYRWVLFGMQEIIKRFDLKPPEGNPNYIHYCFVKKNTNRYFKKHLGFTYSRKGKSFYYMKIKIIDPKKLMVFRLKYGI